jgi:hypothetical protein
MQDIHSLGQCWLFQEGVSASSYLDCHARLQLRPLCVSNVRSATFNCYWKNKCIFDESSQIFFNSVPILQVGGNQVAGSDDHVAYVNTEDFVALQWLRLPRGVPLALLQSHCPPLQIRRGTRCTRLSGKVHESEEWKNALQSKFDSLAWWGRGSYPCFLMIVKLWSASGCSKYNAPSGNTSLLVKWFFIKKTDALRGKARFCTGFMQIHESLTRPHDLKQTSRLWNNAVHATPHRLEYTCCASELSVYPIFLMILSKIYLIRYSFQGPSCCKRRFQFDRSWKTLWLQCKPCKARIKFIQAQRSHTSDHH